jgi:hypothetical protein
MQMTNRDISVSAEYEGDLLQVTVLQVDTIYAQPVKVYRTSLTGHFDAGLYLRAIRVDELQGSKGDICSPAKDSVQALLGTRVGNGFNKAVRELFGPSGCMHFPALLQQMASTAIRCRQINTFQTEGEEAFLKSNRALFDGKCVGYTN